MAQPRTPAPAAQELACGVPVRGVLAPGETASFFFDALPGEGVAIEAVDVSGNRELLQLRLDGPGLRLTTCTGRLQPADSRPGLAHLTGGRYTVEVADCRGDARIEFAVTLNLLSEARRSCGELVPCEETRPGYLTEPGEVDAFRFAAVRDEVIRVNVPGYLDTRGGIELRVFDPDGFPVPEASGCGEQRRFTTPKSGTYTVLANACLGYGTGNYRFTWDTEEDCPPLLLRGLHSAGDSIEVAISPNGARVERIAGTGLTCGFANLSEFQSPAQARTKDGYFAIDSLSLGVSAGDGAASASIDGVLVDSDGDNRPDQALGGLGLAADGGHCVFQWVATNLSDGDGDAWNDILERKLGSDPDDAASVPESSSLPTTTLFGPGVCLDAADNDADDTLDADDTSCELPPTTPSDEPTVYAGRHSGGQAFWLERAPEDEVVRLLDAIDVGCLGLLLPSVHLPLELAIGDNGRFGQQRLEVPTAGAEPALLTVDGIFFDLDGDGIDEQAVGGLEVRSGARRCVRQWVATAHMDSDNDGWSDAVERRLGSDPRPLPQGLGGDSVPEHRLVPARLIGDIDVCADGIDNDGDGQQDGEDSPACPPAQPTATPPPTSSSTPERTATPSATPSQTPVDTTEPTSTAPPLPTLTPTLVVQPTTTPTGPALPTATPVVPSDCVGDCDGDTTITVDELLALVATSLGTVPLDCAAGDIDASGSITVDEIVAAVNHALLGCP